MERCGMMGQQGGGQDRLFTPSISMSTFRQIICYEVSISFLI